jgi:hypothetical protein
MFNNFIPAIVSFMRYVAKCVIARQLTDGNIMQRVRFACWLPTATVARTEYGIGIAFVRQQWLRECTSILHYATLTVFLIRDADNVRGEFRFYKQILLKEKLLLGKESDNDIGNK